MTLEQDVAAAFDLGGQIVHVRPYGQGLINDTFVVSLDTGHRAILQRINRHVFPRPEQIMDNLRALIHDLDPARLHETLPGFHNAPNYLARFTEACVRRRETPDNAELRHCLAFVETRRNLADALETPRREGKLLTRPIHGDTKLNNFLFDAESGRAVSLIDLDTVQPGLIHYDIGDCLRSCANPAGESPEDMASVRFDLDICHAVLKHYFSEAHAFLTAYDHHYIYDAIS